MGGGPRIDSPLLASGAGTARVTCGAGARESVCSRCRTAKSVSGPPFRRASDMFEGCPGSVYVRLVSESSLTRLWRGVSDVCGRSAKSVADLVASCRCEPCSDAALPLRELGDV